MLFKTSYYLIRLALLRHKYYVISNQMLIIYLNNFWVVTYLFFLPHLSANRQNSQDFYNV